MRPTILPFKPCLVAISVAAAFSPTAGAVDYVWSAGNFVVGVTAPSPLVKPDTLSIESGAAKTFSAVAFENQSTVTWNTDDLGFASSSVVTNRGTWDARSDNALVYAGGNPSSFVNHGTLRKSGGAGVTQITQNVGFTNHGTIEAQSGTIDFAGGSANFNDGTQFIGAGVNRVSNNATFTGAIHSANLQLAGGTFQGGGGGAVLTGEADWSGGQFSNVWRLEAGSTLRGKSGTNKTFSGVGFTNAGTLLWQTTENLRFASASSFDNQGLVDLQADASLVYASGNPSSFVNHGTFRKSGGNGLTQIGNNVVFTNNGIVEAQTGTIDFAGGSANFNDGTQFIGAGVNRVSNNATFTGAIHSANLQLAGGTFQGGGGGAVLTGEADWSGGQFSNVWTVGAGSTLRGKAGSNKTFNGVGFTNAGTLLWQTTENLRFASASSFDNQGLVDLQADASLVYASGNPSSFVNHGTLRKSGGTGISQIGNNVVFSNVGALDVQSGTFVLPNNFANPGTLTGGGTVQTNVLTNSGHVAPGNGAGSLGLTGSFVQTALGSLDIQLGGLGGHDLLAITGTSNLSGTLALACVGDCRYYVGDEITILISGGARTGMFSAVTYSGFLTGEFNVLYGANDVRLKVVMDVTPVPEPETWAMLLVGLCLIGLMARRRRC